MQEEDVGLGALPHSQTTNRTINQALLCSDCQFPRCKHSHYGQLLPTHVISPKTELEGDTLQHNKTFPKQGTRSAHACALQAPTLTPRSLLGGAVPWPLFPVSPAFPAADYVSHSPSGSNNQGFLRSPGKSMSMGCVALRYITMIQGCMVINVLHPYSGILYG